jgi:hypothetical protein
MNEQLYIWHMRCFWAGCITVVETTEELARERMKTWENYNPDQPIEKHEIRQGLELGSLGDL